MAFEQAAHGCYTQLVGQLFDSKMTYKSSNLDETDLVFGL